MIIIIFSDGIGISFKEEPRFSLFMLCLLSS